MRKRHKTRYRGVYYRLVDETKPEGDRRYVVWYEDSAGKGRTETLPVGSTLQNALDRQAELRTRKARGERIVKTNMTVEELLWDWLEKRKPSLEPATYDVYSWAIKQHLVPRFARWHISELHTDDVAHMIAELKAAGLKTWTVRKIVSVLSQAYKQAVRSDLVPANPVAKLLSHEKPKGDQRKMRTMQKDEISRLLALAGERWRPLFSFLLFTGLRAGEALTLTWDDIEDGVVHVRKSKTPAGVRQVMLLPALRSSLAELKLKQVPGVQFVFSTRRGGAQSHRDALRALHAAEERAGLPDYTLHELRHTFASIMIAQGELPTFVAKQMGHADPSVTMKTYAHLFEAQESMERARERMQVAYGGMV